MKNKLITPERSEITELVYCNPNYEFWEIKCEAGTLYQILGRGDEIPVAGYTNPQALAKAHGYKTWPHSPRVKALIEALSRAEAAALEAGNRNPDDGGTCNFDSPMIKLPRWFPEEIQCLIFAGVGVSEPYTSKYWKGYRAVRTTRHGQGALRTRMAEAAYKSLKAEAEGYDVAMYYQMD